MRKIEAGTLGGRRSNIEVFKSIGSEDQKVFYWRLIFNKMWKKNAVERNCNKREYILASLSSIISTFLRFRLMQFNLKKNLCGYPRCHFKALQRLKKKKKKIKVPYRLCLWKFSAVLPFEALLATPGSFHPLDSRRLSWLKADLSQKELRRPRFLP